MSSPPEKDKGGPGHPPAVKAGGMRIVQHKTHHHRKSDDNAAPVPQPEETSILRVQNSPPTQSSTHVGGVTVKGNVDFPPEAIQAFHSKPAPTHDKGASPKKPTVIHQPR